MSNPTQAALLKRLRSTSDPVQRRDTALDLLRATRDREKIDASLRALLHDDVIELLDDAHRPTLRDKALYYYEHPAKDRGGLIREQITRLLTAIGHPADSDLYQQGCMTYHRQPTTDSAQNLRAAALAGIARLDHVLACAYATRLLGEPDTSSNNGQPSITAINVLAQHGQRLPVYHFVLRQGRDFIQRGLGDVVSRALEVLGTNFPPALFRELAEDYITSDLPAGTSGIINAITSYRLHALYPLLEQLIRETRYGELRHYALIMLAAARDEALTALLYDLARECDPRDVQDFINAVELTTGDERDTVLEQLERRAQG